MLLTPTASAPVQVFPSVAYGGATVTSSSRDLYFCLSDSAVLDIDALKIGWHILTRHKVKYTLINDLVFLFVCLFVCVAVELPVLDNEIYHAVKPGLSSYKDNPEEVRISDHTG